MQERILRWHIIGGLGDVSLTRKLVSYCEHADLRDKFKVVTLVDIHPAEDVLNPANFEQLFDTIKQKRLKGSVPIEVEKWLKRSLREGNINYIATQPGQTGLPAEYLRSLGSDDIIDIATPNKFHADLTVQALRHSSAHILVEKPVAMSVSQAEILKKAIKNTDLEGRIVMDGDHYQYYSHINHFIRNFRGYGVNSGEGYGLGKINKVDLSIQDDEDFSSERNRQIIEISKSGLGIWLDMGVHALAFLRNLGAKINMNSVQATRYKIPDERIRDSIYGETAMYASFNLKGDERFEEGCPVSIRVGKAMGRENKYFTLGYQNGSVSIDVKGRSLTAKKYETGIPFVVEEKVFDKDAFYHVLNSMYQNVVTGSSPLTTLEKGADNVRDVFEIHARSKPGIWVPEYFN